MVSGFGWGLNKMQLGLGLRLVGLGWVGMVGWMDEGRCVGGGGGGKQDDGIIFYDG
jgi:hypothetical protein